MVSRRKILSRSRDDLSFGNGNVIPNPEEEEDVWYSREKLYKDHIQEVLEKWTQIDDEIWAKVIVLERNRRVAKAYARAPVLTVNGSEDGFDGFRIGLRGFDNPMRDAKTEEVKKHIGHGVKLKMDEQGNILAKRVSKCNVYIKIPSEGDETSVGADVLKLPNCALEPEKPVKLFDMKKFQSNVSRELRRAYPDRRRLECQCLSAIAFVKQETELLDCPVWVLIINIVAMDMLKSKLPPVKRNVVDIRNRPKIPIPDEDPYSIAGTVSGSSGSGSSSGATGTANGGGMVAATREQLLAQQRSNRQEKPPKLPPRDSASSLYHSAPHEIPKPDYDDIQDDDEEEVTRAVEERRPAFPISRGPGLKSGAKNNNKKYHDDPYYCGLRARVPNFVKSKSKQPKENGRGPQPSTAPVIHPRYSSTLSSSISNSHLASATASSHSSFLTPPHHAVMWHARSYDSGMADADLLDSPYNHIYGRLPIPTRGYIPTVPRTMYIGEWD